MRILVLDGEHRSALAAVRSFGRNKHNVIVGSELKKTISGVSKYCKESVQYSTPWINGNKFVKNVIDIIGKYRIDMLLPVTDATMYRILNHENEFRKIVLLPVVSLEQYLKASDKCNLMKTAERLSVPYPKTKYFSKAEDAFKEMINFRYPLVLKPQQSIVELDDRLIHCSVSIIDSERTLIKILTSRLYYQNPFMVQSYVKGDGTAVFALCSGGDLKAYCGHKRIREKPPWGGVSVVSESINPDKSLLEKARVLLNELKWDGVAMVEFKNDIHENVPKLMEINARFWGSLQLSIDAGVDFPNLLIRMYTQKSNITECQICYSRLRWLIGDVDNMIINFKRGNNRTRYLTLKSFIREFFKGSKIEDFRYNDFKPFFMEILQSIN